MTGYVAEINLLKKGFAQWSGDMLEVPFISLCTPEGPVQKLTRLEYGGPSSRVRAGLWLNASH